MAWAVSSHQHYFFSSPHTVMVHGTHTHIVDECYRDECKGDVLSPLLLSSLRYIFNTVISNCKPTIPCARVMIPFHLSASYVLFQSFISLKNFSFTAKVLWVRSTYKTTKHTQTVKEIYCRFLPPINFYTCQLTRPGVGDVCQIVIRTEIKLRI